jgi:hypothetical protein
MKIDIHNFNDNLSVVMRNAGYHPDKQQRANTLSFSRSILQDRYPRFHIYYNEEKKELELHLDHKAPKYENAHDHGAEYSGKLVENEAKRLKTFLEK